MRIPGDNRKWVQTNRSDIYGNLVGTFNCDFETNLGAVRPTRTKLVTDSNTQADLELPVAFAYYFGTYFAITDDFVYKGGIAPNDAFTKDIRSGAPSGDLSEANSDAKVFNGSLYVSGSQDLYKLTNETWTHPIDNNANLASASPHLLETYADRLYITTNHATVLSIDTSDSLATSGANTLNLETANGIDDDTHSITCIKAGTNRLWIGVLDRAGGSGMVFEWDGETVNTPSRVYMLTESAGPVAMVIRDDVPYIMTAEGRLMSYNLGGFREVARLPVGTTMLQDALSSSNLRFLHPNGMAVAPNGRIQAFICNQNADSQTEEERSTEEFLHSGVWEYDDDQSFTHKYSVSNTTDYGQVRISEAGALFNAKTISSIPASDDNGELLMGAGFYDSEGNVDFGIFIDDTKATATRYGSFTTTHTFSGHITDSWQKVYARFRKFLGESDTLTLKYRTIEEGATEIDINWLDTTRFTTTTADLSAMMGYEVEILSGIGAGTTAHIESVNSSSATWTVTLDETITGATGIGTARVTNWKKAGKCQSQLKQFHEYPTPANDIRIQVKAVMKFTGAGEVYDLDIKSKQLEK